MLEIINSPWKNRFMQCVSETIESIQICSPFIKYDVIEEIYKYKKDKVDFDLITNFSLSSFYKRASDIEAIDYILNKNGRVKNYQNLHAKIYIFDKRTVIVTSANLTNYGLSYNYEYGILSDDYIFVDKVCKDFNSIFHSEFSGEVTKEIVNTVNDILNNIPKEKKPKFPHINLDSFLDNDIPQDDLYTGGVETIENCLSGWKLAVFKQINKIDKFIFELNDVYQYKAYFQSIYPENQNIEAKIRQQLQNLRDLGLIKFLGKGRYMKLWI